MRRLLDMIWQDEVDYRLVQHISKMNDVIRMQRKPCAVRQKKLFLIEKIRLSQKNRKLPGVTVVYEQ